MASITVHGGDFKKSGSYMLGTLFLTPSSAPFGTQAEAIPATTISEIDIATEESFRRVGGAIGWSLVGAAVIGPAGFLAGLVLGGGKRKEITFVAALQDGRKMIATADAATYAKLAGAALTAAQRSSFSRSAGASPMRLRVDAVVMESFCPSCKGWSDGKRCVSCGADKPASVPTRSARV